MISVIKKINSDKNRTIKIYFGIKKHLIQKNRLLEKCWIAKSLLKMGIDVKKISTCCKNIGMVKSDEKWRTAQKQRIDLFKKINKKGIFNIKTLI